jgi:hypothetical protein
LGQKQISDSKSLITYASPWVKGVDTVGRSYFDAALTNIDAATDKLLTSMSRVYIRLPDELSCTGTPLLSHSPWAHLLATPVNDYFHLCLWTLCEARRHLTGVLSSVGSEGQRLSSTISSSNSSEGGATSHTSPEDVA